MTGDIITRECEVCKTRMRETNHWLRAFLTRELLNIWPAPSPDMRDAIASRLFRPGTGSPELISPTLKLYSQIPVFVCGDSCLSKLVSIWSQWRLRKERP